MKTYGPRHPSTEIDSAMRMEDQGCYYRKQEVDAKIIELQARYEHLRTCNKFHANRVDELCGINKEIARRETKLAVENAELCGKADILVAANMQLVRMASSRGWLLQQYERFCDWRAHVKEGSREWQLFEAREDYKETEGEG